MSEPPVARTEPKYDVTILGGTVGIIGDHGTVVMPRREIAWPVAVGNPPPLASGFQDRAVIIDRIQAHSGVPLKQVLTGTGGVGKTQIAVRLFGASPADLRVWVSAESRSAVVTGFAQAAVSLDLADDNVAPDRLAALFLSYVRTTDRSWLVVLDDLADPADVGGLWPEGNGHIVVTTRRRDAALSAGGRTVVDVDVYTGSEAEAYLVERLTPLRARLPTDVLDEAAALAQDLGHLPLALAQAAAVIIDQAISCGLYRLWFREHSRDLTELFPADAEATDGYDRTVISTWNLAIAAADRLEPIGLALPMAQLCAALDPAGVPEHVLTSGAACWWLGDNSDHAVPVEPLVARKVLRNLDRLSLISHDPQSGPRAVRMHNLTGRAIQFSLDASTVTAVVDYAAACLKEVWPKIENDRALSEALRSNTDVLRHVGLEDLWRHASEGLPLMVRSGQSLLHIGLVGAAVRYFEQLIDEAQRLFGPAASEVVALRNYLAGAYRSAGRLSQAIPLLQQTLAALEEELGVDHPYSLIARENLAGAYQEGGDLTRAIELLEQTLADRERILGHDDPQTLVARGNLASAYQDAGNLSLAVALMEETLASRERVIGPDHPETLIARSNLAGAYQEVGEFAKAIELLERTVADSERVNGLDLPPTLTARNVLASAHLAAGDLARATPLLEQSLADRDRVLGPDHPATHTSRNNLAYAYLQAGDVARAMPLLERGVADGERLLGPDHPDSLLARSNLAFAYLKNGDALRARPLLEVSLADHERILGSDHPNTLTARNNLAGAYQEVGDLVRAIDQFERNLADHERVLGPDHPQTVRVRNNLRSAKAAATA